MNTRSHPTAPSTTTRLEATLTLANVARPLGWALLVLAAIVLSRPVASHLAAADGRQLEPSLQGVSDVVQPIAGAVGLALVLLGGSPRVSGIALPLRRGHAVLLLMAAGLALVVGEAGLRVLNLRRWGSAVAMPWPVSTIRPSGEWNLRPGVYTERVGSDFDPELRRGIRFTINRYGLRGPLPEGTPSGRPRVICLGGSSTMGYTVTDGEEWPLRLQDHLASVHAEVIDAGRPGATTWSDFRYLRDRLLQLRPDVVLIYEGFNDLWRGVRRHGGEQPDYGRVDTALPPIEEPLDLGPPRPWMPRLSFLSYYLARRLEGRLEGHGRPQEPGTAAERGAFRYDPAITSLYSHNLASIVRLCHARGVTPVIATFAGCDDATRPAEEQRLRLRYALRVMPQLDLDTAHEGIALYREMTRRVAAAEGAHLIDAAERMSHATEYYTDLIHFTPAGEDRLASVMAEDLVAVLRNRRPHAAATAAIGARP